VCFDRILGALALLGVILVTAWTRGAWAGALGLVAGAAAVDFLWLAPLYFLRLAGAREQLVLGVLVALGAVILLLLHSLPNDRGPR
jgi:K+-sensing histidine kinase KdpD